MVRLIARDGVENRRTAGAPLAMSRSRDRHARGARVRVRGEVSVAEDAEVPANDSARSASDRVRSERIAFGRRARHPTISCSGIATAIRCANPSCCGTCCSRRPRAAGLGRVTWHQFRHIHSSLLNDLRVPVEDRPGAAGAREHFDDAQHLHARRRCLAPQGDRSARTRIVPNCSQIAGRPQAGRFRQVVIFV